MDAPGTVAGVDIVVVRAGVKTVGVPGAEGLELVMVIAEGTAEGTGFGVIGFRSCTDHFKPIWFNLTVYSCFNFFFP